MIKRIRYNFGGSVGDISNFSSYSFNHLSLTLPPIFYYEV